MPDSTVASQTRSKRLASQTAPLTASQLTEPPRRLASQTAPASQTTPLTATQLAEPRRAPDARVSEEDVPDTRLRAIQSGELAEIIDGAAFGTTALRNFVQTKDVDQTMLTTKQAEAFQDKTPSVQERYDAVREKNVFHSILPYYVQQCSLTMKRHGLQVIHITPHISGLVAKIGFEPIVEATVLQTIQQYANPAQIRLALQLRNLLAKTLVLSKKNLPVHWSTTNGIERKKHGLCTLSDEYLLTAFSKSTPQTILLGVHRGEMDQITSMCTYKPAEPQTIRLNGSANAELTQYAKTGKLALFDIACSPPENTQNKLLNYQKSHFKLLMYYAFLGILKEVKQGARKYLGICAALIGARTDKGDLAYMLEKRLTELGFVPYTRDGGEPQTKYYIFYGDEAKVVAFIERLHAKIKENSSPYITELCKKGAVCE